MLRTGAHSAPLRVSEIILVIELTQASLRQGGGSRSETEGVPRATRGFEEKLHSFGADSRGRLSLQLYFAQTE